MENLSVRESTSLSSDTVTNYSEISTVCFEKCYVSSKINELLMFCCARSVKIKLLQRAKYTYLHIFFYTSVFSLQVLETFAGRLIRIGVLARRDIPSLTKYQIILARDQYRKNPSSQNGVNVFIYFTLLK